MKLGLCLSGGGIKGAAHIGVLKAFEESKIKIDYLSGTSSGSIVAALYASGYTSQGIYAIFKKYSNKIKYVDFLNVVKGILGLLLTRKIVINGLTSGNAIERLIKKTCNEKGVYKISDVKMPLIIPSVDLHTGALHIFSSLENRIAISDEYIYDTNISIEAAVRASCSYPRSIYPL
jgi:NTE family protein